jgi:hypothetical protein
MIKANEDNDLTRPMSIILLPIFRINFRLINHKNPNIIYKL